MAQARRQVLANRNPVRTGGPMQVSVTFAEHHAANRAYPYPITGAIRHEVFTRRGGCTSVSRTRSITPRPTRATSIASPDLELAQTQRFERTRLYRRVLDLADRLSGVARPRAVLPQLELQSPKITRKLTTAWFARRVESRYTACLRRAAVKDRPESVTAS